MMRIRNQFRRLASIKVQDNDLVARYFNQFKVDFEKAMDEPCKDNFIPSEQDENDAMVFLEILEVILRNDNYRKEFPQKVDSILRAAIVGCGCQQGEVCKVKSVSETFVNSFLKDLSSHQ